MSFTTTIMFAPRIWGFELAGPAVRVARAAGWHHADLLWEAVMEQGCRAWQAGDAAAARRAFRRAAWIAVLLPRSDLRRAATAAALGVMALSAGRKERAARHFRRAARLFDTQAAAAVAAMRIAPRARSSLFHLRMEARHRDTYHANMRLRLSRFTAETREAIAALAAGDASPHRLYSRWLGERPTVHDDTRKVLSACLLIPDRPPLPPGEYATPGQ